MQTVLALVRTRRSGQPVGHPSGRCHRRGACPASHSQRGGVERRGDRTPQAAHCRGGARLECRGERPGSRADQDPHGRLPPLYGELQADAAQPGGLRHPLRNLQFHARTRLDAYRPGLCHAGRFAGAAFRARRLCRLRPLYPQAPRCGSRIRRRSGPAAVSNACPQPSGTSLRAT